MKHLLRSLRHSDYRRYFISQTVSLIGTWAQQVAQAWLIYRLTGSALMLGVVALAQQGPGFFAGPFAGVFVDRHNKRRILVVTQSAAAIAALFLAVVTLFGMVAPWHVLIAAFALGVVHALDIPARQSSFIEMVGRADLANAIALNSTIVNGARLVGPAIAGVLIISVGEGFCFLLNAFSYLPIIIGYSRMTFCSAPRLVTEGGDKSSVWKEMRQGLSFVRHNRQIAGLFGLHAVCALLGMPYLILLPAHSSVILLGGAGTLSFLMACAGGGAMTGALVVASRHSVSNLFRWALFGGMLFGVGLLAFASVRSIEIAAVLLFIAGLGCMIQAASTNTLLQTLAPDSMRGRIVSLYASLYMGMVPLGGFLAGALADRWTTSPVLAVAGIGVTAGTYIFSKSLHPLDPEKDVQDDLMLKAEG